MKKILIFTIFFLISNCSFNKVVQNHGIHNLEKKQTKLKVNLTNKNDIFKIIGPPSTKSTFDNDIYIYIERKTSSSKLTKLGKKKVLLNNVLVLEFDNKGMLISKKFYNKDEMNKLKFDDSNTNLNYTKRSFVNDFLFSLRQRIDDPLGKKRVRSD